MSHFLTSLWTDQPHPQSQAESSGRSKNNLEAEMKVTPAKSPGYTCRQNVCSFSCLLAVCCILFFPDSAGLLYFELKFFTSNYMFTWPYSIC